MADAFVQLPLLQVGIKAIAEEGICRCVSGVRCKCTKWDRRVAAEVKARCLLASQVAKDAKECMDGVAGRLGRVFYVNYHPKTYCVGCAEAPVQGALYTCFKCKHNYCASCEVCHDEDHPLIQQKRSQDQVTIKEEQGQKWQVVRIVRRKITEGKKEYEVQWYKPFFLLLLTYTYLMTVNNF